VRLTNIKLSGFKSFADSTQLLLPGQLVGVVGPNGCGKSNIMDAVRWVLGESRASELRGESMQDVIFNGTNLRKAASRSSVELVFDNADHRAGGQWSQFAEIAVKRVLTREGSSSYYLNNMPVRRRDVQDVFLGTGLGPRAYAIIGQGTISRIIESKPEELRLFLEEAAGVSKYKERRRETENRLSDTRENLTRVDDILRELNAQLEKLELQASVAQQYNDLQLEVTTRQQQLWWLKWQEAKLQQEQYKHEIEKNTLELDAKVADLRHIESEIETLRQAHYATGDEVNQAQGVLYESSAEVGRLEAQLRFIEQSRQKAEQRLAVLVDQRESWQTKEAQALEELGGLDEKTQAQSERLEQLTAQTEEVAVLSEQLQEEWTAKQGLEREQHARVIEVQQQLQVLASEQRSVQTQSNQLQERQERLELEVAGLNAPDPARLSQVQEKLMIAREQALQAQTDLTQLQEQVPVLEEERRLAQERVNQENATYADLSAKLEALKELQANVLDNGRLKPWLTKHGLQDLPALWSQLQVQEGWETALESALKERMRSMQVGRLESVQSLDQDPPPAKVTFHELPKDHPTLVNHKLPRLMDKVHCHDASLAALLGHWLAGAYTAEHLSQAFAARSQYQLSQGEFIYTQEGHSVGAQSVMLYAPDDEQSGVLERAQKIENLDKQLKAQQLMREESDQSLLRTQASYGKTLKELEEARLQTLQAQKLAHDTQVESLGLAQLFDQTRLKRETLLQSQEEVKQSLAQFATQSEELDASVESLDMQLGDLQEHHVRVQDQVQSAQVRHQQALEQSRSLEREAQELEFALREVKTREGELQRVIQTAQEQMQSIVAEREQLSAELELASLDSTQAALQEALAMKLEREQALAAKRSAYDDLTAKLRASDERRLSLERALDPLRQRGSDLQLKEQAARLNQEQYNAQLLEAQADLDAIQALIVQDAVKLTGLSSEIDRLNRQISQLGAVNLAALDELQHARERKAFLDAQTLDLTQAMQTLESAIRKIDGETRDLLGATFHSVNEHFGRMFPELFGGGNAKLVMTGQEILDTGVQVWAQPPGKKNQTIHLLSGGEKALTAIALVFAIFQLNPAPFCLLDEVDAPLDDSNTERYSKLVKSMSKETQFLFISHNKIAMEMAEQLIGVTMQEQGVSRIVAVDMESAISMAEAA
jgi:chromosome segregation protein